MKNYRLFGFIFLIPIYQFSAQEFDLSAEIRPRFENRHGFKTLIHSDDKAANFISQRTRLNVLFNQEKLTLGIELQNVRVWGDVSTTNTNDTGNSFHQAWVQYDFDENFSIKMGRQEIVYDDSRIFGNVDWAQQARSFDAIIAKLKLSENSVLHLGYSLNNDKENLTKVLYSNIAGYKTFQYAWFHKSFTDFTVSLLALNNGVEYVNQNTDYKTDFSQTLGGRATFQKEKLTADAASYFQIGNSFGNNVNAYYLAGNIHYQIFEKFKLSFGTEYLSGKDTNNPSSDIKSFNPFYGTNHKFNGFMDYFYVGNNLNSVGLLDIYATFGYSNKKFSIQIIPHFFTSAASIQTINSTLRNYLGTEIDAVVSYKIDKNIHLQGGFSKIFATKSLEFIKGENNTESNYWSWLMLTFKPTLFTSK